LTLFLQRETREIRAIQATQVLREPLAQLAQLEPQAPLRQSLLAPSRKGRRWPSPTLAHRRLPSLTSYLSKATRAIRVTQVPLARQAPRAQQVPQPQSPWEPSLQELRLPSRTLARRLRPSLTLFSCQVQLEPQARQAPQERQEPLRPLRSARSSLAPLAPTPRSPTSEALARQSLTSQSRKASLAQLVRLAQREQQALQALACRSAGLQGRSSPRSTQLTTTRSGLTSRLALPQLAACMASPRLRTP